MRTCEFLTDPSTSYVIVVSDRLTGTFTAILCTWDRAVVQHWGPFKAQETGCTGIRLSCLPTQHNGVTQCHRLCFGVLLPSQGVTSQA